MQKFGHRRPGAVSTSRRSIRVIEKSSMSHGSNEALAKTDRARKSPTQNNFGTHNHHRVDIVMAERIRLKQRKTQIGFSKGEMREVISDKREHDQAAHDHVA